MTTAAWESFEVDGEEIEVVASFTFLGSMIEKGGRSEMEIKRRITLGKTAMNGPSKIWKDKHVSVETHKTDRISQYMREVLHWLPFPQRISFRIASLVRRCLTGCAPSYLCELCRPLSAYSGRRALRSSEHGDLMIPFARSAAMQNRSFAVVGPTTWNGLSLTIRTLPAGGNSQFHQLLKTNFYRLAWVGSASE